MSHADLNGILLIDKPYGATSASIVNLVKRRLRVKKIGHTGTLDPLATGLLPICMGKATKISYFLLNEDKTYIAEIKLGIITDTYDMEGTVISENIVPEYTQEFIIENLNKFNGEISQEPPKYSAVKYKGKRLYSWTREGYDIKVKPKIIKIYYMKLLNYYDNIIQVEVACSKGTYIRSLAFDIGQTLGCGAYLYSLIRTKIGKFNIEDSINPNILRNYKDIEELKIVSINNALDYMPQIIINDAQLEKVVKGDRLNLDEPVDRINNSMIRLIDERGQLVAIGKLEDNIIYPKKVLV